MIYRYLKLLLTTLMVTAAVITSHSQCVWQTEVSDGFEYTTVIPDLIPGTTVHNTPQTFAVHSGTYSCYMNFINCTGGTGTCAGAKVYERTFVVCRNQPLRFSGWFTTSFSGTQCNMRVVIYDGDTTNILQDTPSILAPYAPSWIQYQSGQVVPTTDTVIFTMYTNVGGGNGNDLSFDDFLMEKCVGSSTTTVDSHICANSGAVDLYSFLPGINDTTGTWSGTSVLGNGYLGNFDPLVNGTGIYIYEFFPFGTNPGCPLGYDTVNVTLQQPPVVELGNDTTICTNQSVLLSAGTGTGYTYLWSNGVTGPNVLAFTTSTTTITNNYSVTVTDSIGCISHDSISVTFEVCQGLNELSGNNTVMVVPNPADEFIMVMNLPGSRDYEYSIFSSLGAEVLKGNFSGMKNTIPVATLNKGVYWIYLYDSGGDTIVVKFAVQ